MSEKLEGVHFDNREDVNKVLDQLINLMHAYGQVTVAEFYDIVGTTIHYTNNLYGWINLSEACIIVTDLGYILNLPKPISLKKTEGVRFDKKDNKAILKLLGTEYMMELRHDKCFELFVLTIRDSQDHVVSKTLSELEVEESSRNVLLCAIEQCILSFDLWR